MSFIDPILIKGDGNILAGEVKYINEQNIGT